MKGMAKYIITVISDFWVSKFAQYTIQKIAPALAHSLQVKGFSPECVLMCVLRLLDTINDFEHSLQVNGFSFECVLM